MLGACASRALFSFRFSIIWVIFLISKHCAEKGCRSYFYWFNYQIPITSIDNYLPWSYLPMKLWIILWFQNSVRRNTVRIKLWNFMCDGSIWNLTPTRVFINPFLVEINISSSFNQFFQRSILKNPHFQWASWPASTAEDFVRIRKVRSSTK